MRRPSGRCNYQSVSGRRDEEQGARDRLEPRRVVDRERSRALRPVMDVHAHVRLESTRTINFRRKIARGSGTLFWLRFATIRFSIGPSFEEIRRKESCNFHCLDIGTQQTMVVLPFQLFEIESHVFRIDSVMFA